MRRSSRLGLVATFGLVIALYAQSPAYGQTSPSLGNATSYSVLAGSEVTNTGVTTISGDVGISPGIGAAPHFSGFGTVVFTGGGTVHDADGSAGNAMAARGAAVLALNAQACTFDYGAVTKELAGQTLLPGVHCANRFFLSGGTLTLAGAASDTFIFKSAADLIITGGAAARVASVSCNVWWTLVSSATFDANSSLVGNILAETSITMAAGASLSGRALARTAAVTLSSNNITSCAAVLPPPPPPPPPPPACVTTRPDVFIVKNHTDPFVVGANARYRIALFNAGAATTNPITVTDTVPAGLAIVSAVGVGWTCTVSGQVVSCTTAGTIAAAGPHPNSITLTVVPGAAAVPAVTNTATVTGAGDCDLTNNTTSDATLVSAPTPVPTLSEWAFIMLALLLAAAGIVALQRRNAA